MRTFAIINTHEDIDLCQNIISKIPCDDKIYIFQTKDNNFETKDNLEIVKIPTEMQVNCPKIKNFVSNYFFSQDFKGFLHVIEDTVQILKDPIEFLIEIEKMMSKLDQKSWFNTITDPCNYTFTIYNPRFSVELDEPSIKEVYDKTIYWTSHANTSWICYDYSKATFDDIKFDESFSIPMFYIIKFLAERRNNRNPGELYYMNFYPTVKEERGVFKNIQHRDDDKHTQKDFQIEQQIYESQKINNEADMIIEAVMDDIVNLMKK